MQLQTNIPVTPQEPKINYHSKILLLGSCFAENIAKKFHYFKFQHTANPYGIIFHPLVLARLVNSSLSIATPLDKTSRYFINGIFQNNERWHSFDAHSTLSTASKKLLINSLDDAAKQMKQAIQEATHIIISLGTAWGYIEKESGLVVANCHKVPQQKFDKQLASITELTIALQAISKMLSRVNPSAKMILTVSPVRHIKDSFVGNARSKAHLISAAHQSISATNNITYFPSYELMMDELRDYRFYDEDMLHPNQTAINYIWERFSETWCSDGALQVSKRVDEIQRGLAHKPFSPSSQAHQQFLQKLQHKRDALEAEFTHMSFEV